MHMPSRFSRSVNIGFPRSTLFPIVDRPTQPHLCICHRQQLPVITDALLERGCAERTMKNQTPLLSPRSAATSARTSERI